MIGAGSSRCNTVFLTRSICGSVFRLQRIIMDLCAQYIVVRNFRLSPFIVSLLSLSAFFLLKPVICNLAGLSAFRRVKPASPDALKAATTVKILESNALNLGMLRIQSYVNGREPRSCVLNV